MPASFTIQGLDEFYTFVTLVNPKLRETFFKVANEYAGVMQGTMRSTVPVRTGYLRSTIGKDSSPTEVKVYVDAPYAGYVNFGTRYMKARPYFTGTIEEMLPEFEKALDQETDKALSG